MYFAWKGMKKLLQKAAKGNERISPPQKNQACNASHFQKLRFVRFPALGTISGHHLGCVQRFLFSLFHSNFLVQSLSNSIFWLKESDFGLDKWYQACFWKKLPPKPESSIQLKSFILRRFLRGILHKKGWPANPDAKSIWNFSLFKVRLAKFVEVGTFCCQDQGSEIQFERLMLECDCTSKHLKRKKMQPPKPKSKIYLEISVSHSFCTKMYKQFWWRSTPCGHLRGFLSKHLFCHVFPVSQWWETLQTSHLECLPKNWNVFRMKRNEKITSESGKG